MGCSKNHRRSKGPKNDPQYHNNLVILLRKVGMNDEANELELVRISDELSGKFVGGRTGWKYFVLKDRQGNAVASGRMEDIKDFLGINK
jgi:hypothetical protein